MFLAMSRDSSPALPSSVLYQIIILLKYVFQFKSSLTPFARLRFSLFFPYSNGSFFETLSPKGHTFLCCFSRMLPDGTVSIFTPPKRSLLAPLSRETSASSTTSPNHWSTEFLHPYSSPPLRSSPVSRRASRLSSSTSTPSPRRTRTVSAPS